MIGGMLSLLEGAAAFADAAEAVEEKKKKIIEVACGIVEQRAKSIIGVPHPYWPPLSAETLKRKDGVNTPLLETGELRDSIEHTVESEERGHVGSNNDKAVWHELGTSRIPARPFLLPAALESVPLIEAITGETVVVTIKSALR